MSDAASAESTRFRMTVNLSRTAERAQNSAFTNPLSADIPALGELMRAAYRGTPDEDDAGQTTESATEEIGRVFNGEYGELISEASFIARQGNEPIAATLVTAWQGEPLLAYVFTAPSHTGRGLARNLIMASMNALADYGHARLNLAVTENNARAWKLYEKIGFQRFNGA
jgi:ribosomal protein S18 acetylase RimI-like enzyme